MQVSPRDECETPRTGNHSQLSSRLGANQHASRSLQPIFDSQSKKKRPKGSSRDSNRLHVRQLQTNTNVVNDMMLSDYMTPQLLSNKNRAGGPAAHA